MRVYASDVQLQQFSLQINQPVGFADNISNYSVAVNTSIVKMLFVLEEDAPYQT